MRQFSIQSHTVQHHGSHISVTLIPNLQLYTNYEYHSRDHLSADFKPLNYESMNISLFVIM